MKLPNSAHLASLTKAPVDDPVIAAGIGNAGTRHNATTGRNDSTIPNASITPELAKVTVRVPRELAAQARTAFHIEAASGAVGSFSEWVATALERAVEHSARTFNNGQPYEPSVEALPAGRTARMSKGGL